jgi:acetate---CoA ligase (ADP-forming)
MAESQVTEGLPREVSRYAVDELLRDGGSIRIRAIRPDDKARLREHFRRLSPRAVYQRFFGAKRDLSDEDLRGLTELDFRTRVGLAATLRDAGGEERFIGVGHYIVTTDPHRAELGFAVLDEFQRRGVGTLLLKHLWHIARAAGITEFEADVLGDNNRMLEMFARSGFRVQRSFDSGIVHVSFATEATSGFAAADLAREQIAAAQSIARLVAPRSAAVVGASSDRRKIGGAILANLIAGGFQGPIYPINVKAQTVQELKSYPGVGTVDAPVDLAVIAVPAQAVEGVVADCARAGVRSVVVITAGFAEVSQTGRETQRRLVESVRQAGMRMVGPNCLGILNTDPAVRLNATFAPTTPPAGNIGMFSESGALGIVILDQARARNVGISTFISAGNRADVSSNDLLAYWAGDPRTAVITMYLESFGNPRKFARLAPQVARTKPIIALKAGRTAAGTRAASSHSAALATLDVAVDALFEQAGVIRTTTLEEFFDVAVLLSRQPVPKGPRVGVVTNAGGPAILLADACEAHRLELPPSSPQTLATLRSFLSSQAGLTNPVDMTAAVGASQYERAIATLGNDPNIDALVTIYVPTSVTSADDAAAGIAAGAGAIPSDKPILAVFLSSDEAPAALHRGPRGSLPTYRFPENAAIALAHACRYGRWRARPRGTALELSGLARDVIRSVVDRALAHTDEPRWLDVDGVATILRAAGIEVAVARRTTLDRAVEDAEHLGYPLVAKAIVPGLVHKSDVGGVIMGLESADAVARAASSLGERIRKIAAHLDGILLQREIREGIEMMVGVTSDPNFGPLLVCGPGGVLVELLKDAAFRLHPVTDLDGAEMLRELKSYPLLEGYRGSPPADRDALVETIRKVSALVEAAPELTDLDLNPIKVLPPGKGAIVVDARMRLAPVKFTAA